MSIMLEELSANKTVDSHSLSSDEWDKIYLNYTEEPTTTKDKKDEGWRKILHIPFDPVWRVVLMALVTVRILLIIASVSILKFDPDEHYYKSNILTYAYLCLLYFLDTLLHTMAKIHRTQRSTSLNLFLPNSVLVCDFLSCIPLAVFFPSSIAHKSQYLPSFLQMNEILRIIRLLYLFADFRETVGVNHIAALYLNAFFFIALSMCTSISAGYTILKYQWPGPPSELTSAVTKLGSTCISLVTMFAVIEGGDTFLHLYITLAMFIGFAYFTVYSLALVLTKLKAVLKKKYVFLTIKKFFDVRWKYLSSTQDLHDTFKDVYQTIWVHRQGYLDVDMNFSDVIASSMQKDLFLDINCPLFKHSKVFRKMDFAFLRVLASMVKHEHLFAGQVIFRRNTIKNKMIYLASGKIKVMSKWDEDTALMTFTEGTILGESSLVVNTKSITTVRCETYCIIYLLERKEFEKCSVKFPENYGKVNAAINKRIDRARKLKQLATLANQKLSTSTTLDQNSIMWLKLTLHSLMMKDEITSSKHTIQNLFLAMDFSMERFKDMQFTAENLDMLVIADRTAMSDDSVFKSTTFPWIITSKNVIKTVWDIAIIILAILFTAFFLFYGFGLATVPYWMKRFSEFITVLYVFDTYILLSTVVKHNDNYLVRMKDIISYHVRHARFYLALFAAFPTEIFLCIFDHKMTDRNVTLIKGNRCLKLWRIYLFFKERQKRSSTESLAWTYFIHIVIFLALYFCCACVAFLVGDMIGATDEEDTTMFWYFFATETIVANNGILGKIHVLENSPQFSALLRLISLFLFLIAFSHLCAIHILQEFSKINYKMFINEIHYFSKKYNFSDGLRRRLNRLLITNWHIANGNDLLHNLPLYPDNVRTLYKTHMFYQKLLKNPLFRNISSEALREICANASVKSLPDREALVYSGQMCNASIFILRGYIKKVSENDVLDDRLYAPGDHLLFLETWLNVNVVNSYISASTVIFLEISTKTWKLVNTKYPGDFSRFTKIMNDLQIAAKLRNMRSRYTVDLVRELIESAPPKTPSVNSFGYNLPIGSPEEYEYYVPFDRSSWGWIQYFLLRYTFLPDGKFLIIWETSRCFFFLVSLLWHCFYFSSTNPLSGQYLAFTLDLFPFLDMYLRLHVCYYNDEGILVSHPLKTASHYLSHSFVTDFIGTAPFYWLFPRENYYFYVYLLLLQSYRYAGVISYAKNHGLRISSFLANVKFIPPFLSFCIILGNCLVRQACHFGKNIGESAEYTSEVVCKTDTWITSVTSKRPLTPEHVQLYGLYLATVSFTSCGALKLRLADMSSATIVSFIMVTSFFTLAFMFSTVVNEHLAIGNRYLRHNTILTLVKRIMRKEHIRPLLQNQVFRHFNLKWHRKKGLPRRSVFDNFPLCIKKDIFYDMYGKILQEYSILSSEESVIFFRDLCIHLTHDVAIKGCFIAAINDIVSNVYFLLDGSVEVVGPDGSILTKLYMGSMFGNLDTYENARQSIAIIASENVEFLSIKTTLFHNILGEHPGCKRLFRNLTAIHIDFLKGRFVPPVETKRLQKYSYTRKNPFVYNFRKVWRCFHLIFVCYLGVVFNIYCCSVEIVETPELYILFATDILHFLNFFIILVAYKDKLGYYVDDYKYIWKRVWRSKYFFIADILAVVPLDVIPLIAPGSVAGRYKAFCILRLFKNARIQHVYHYFNDNEYKTLNSLHRTLFLYSTAWVNLAIHILANTFVKMQIYCGVTFVNMEFNVVNLEENTFNQKINFYLDNLNYVTAMTSKKIHQIFHPNSNYLLGLSIPIIFLMLIVHSTFMAQVCAAAQRSFALFTNHYLVTEKILALCDGENISEGLRNRILRYMQLLWRKQKGFKMISVFSEISPYHRELVMNAAYGHHIFQHYIFRQCHVDFNRQLVSFFVCTFYYPGDFIVFKGTYNECMYFVHAGVVEVLADDGTRDSEVIEVLKKGQYFGVHQGLTVAPYLYSYRSKTITTCLILCKKQWKHLLQFFPASERTINKRMKEFHE
ncbi:uncharacterized protein LOC108733088 [Agrilus planipennis]|uniref:Uncharacterized protein LOC108733088 n=1 Tax=Agrilus planipennis TaxID=224129 RepID=A0A1W4WGQ4_AGRPL|nr:uncharacterized protein LOC108733088 [Agrilus planipennis]